MDVVDLHRRACDEFGRRIRSVRPEQWAAPTPCQGWDVRALVGHVVSEDLWTAPLIAGRTTAEVGDRFSGDLLADDPVRAYDRAAQEAMAAVGQPGALQRTVHLSFGNTPAEEYVWQLFADHLIHAWDLASAVDADDRLDPGLVAACATWFTAQEAGYRAAGAIGPRPPNPVGADQQTTLLAAFGRQDRRPPARADGVALAQADRRSTHG